MLSAPQRPEDEADTANSNGAEDDIASGHFWDFVKDGLHMLVRSATLQVSPFQLLLCSASILSPKSAYHDSITF
jgi:hypothetical protein